MSGDPEAVAPTPLSGSQQKPLLEVHTDRAAIALAADSLTKCFTHDPVMRWSLRRPDGNTLADDEVFRRRYFKVLMTLAWSGGAQITNVDGQWKCVGVFFPPGKTAGGWRGYLACWTDIIWCLWKAGWTTSRYVLLGHHHFVSQFRDAAFPERPEIMRDGDYYNLYFLGTQVESRGLGLGSALLKYVQQVATEAGKPVYLQSSTEQNRNLYKKHGFEVIKELNMGEGQVGGDGRVASDDAEKKGVVWWALTWWPESLKSAGP